MSGLGQQIEQLVGSLRGLFEPKRTRRTGTIVHIQRDGPDGTTGRPVYAVMQIGESANEIVPVGNAMAVHTGDVWAVTGSGDPAAPEWRLDIRQQSAAPAMGADLEQDRVSLIIPTYTDPADLLSQPIGAISEEHNNSLTGPSGSPLAQVRVFYRTIVPGSYSVYGGAENVKTVDLYLRKTSEENYGAPAGSSAVWPTRPVHVLLAGSLAAGGLSVSVTLPGDITINDIISGYHVYWRLKDEVAIAKLVDTGGGAYQLQFTSDGRGVESTTAVAHASNVKAELLCGRVSSGGLEPAQTYKLYIQSGTGYGVPGDKSNEVTFTSWQRTSLPAVGTCTVEQREGGAFVSWTRPVSGGLPLTHVYYRIYRNTTATTVGATTVEGRVDALTAFVQGSNGSGNYYGIQVLDTMGNESAVTWGSDTAAPPHPALGSIVIEPSDMQVEVRYTAASDGNASKSDRGFKEFVLYRATSSTGTGATEVMSSPSNSFFYVPPLTQGYWYQVAARDWGGNTSTLDNTDGLYWQFALPYSFSVGELVNGNFQTPGPTRNITGVSATASSAVITSTLPMFAADDVGKMIKVADAGPGGRDLYALIGTFTSSTQVVLEEDAQSTVSGKTGYVGGYPYRWKSPLTFPLHYPMAITHQDSGGVMGNRLMRMDIEAGYYAGSYEAPSMYLRNTPPVAYAPKTDTTADWGFSIRATSGVTITYAVYYYLFLDDFGEGAGTQVNATANHVGTGNWTRITGSITSATMFGSGVTYRTYALQVFVILGGTPVTLGADAYVEIDQITSVVQ